MNDTITRAEVLEIAGAAVTSVLRRNQDDRGIIDLDDVLESLRAAFGPPAAPEPMPVCQHDWAASTYHCSKCGVMLEEGEVPLPTEPEAGEVEPETERGVNIPGMECASASLPTEWQPGTCTGCGKWLDIPDPSRLAQQQPVAWVGLSSKGEYLMQWDPLFSGRPSPGDGTALPLFASPSPAGAGMEVGIQLADACLLWFGDGMDDFQHPTEQKIISLAREVKRGVAGTPPALPEGNCPRCDKPWIIHDCPVDHSNDVCLVGTAPSPERVAAWQELERRVLDAKAWREDECRGKDPAGTQPLMDWLAEPLSSPSPAACLFTQAEVLAVVENLKRSGFACGSCGSFQDTHWFCPICHVITAEKAQAVAAAREEERDKCRAAVYKAEANAADWVERFKYLGIPAVLADAGRPEGGK